MDERFWQFHGVRRRRELEPTAKRWSVGRSPTSSGAALAAWSSFVCSVRLRFRSNRCRAERRAREPLSELTVSAIVPASDLGDFSLDAQQGEVRAVFVPLVFVQRELSIRGRVNTILVSVERGHCRRGRRSDARGAPAASGDARRCRAVRDIDRRTRCARSRLRRRTADRCSGASRARSARNKAG